MQSLRKLFLVVLLLGAMFTPTALQWTHMADNHASELVCQDSRLHLHEQELPCPLGMSFVPPYLVGTVFWSSQEVLPLAEEQPIAQIQILESQNYFSLVSRGPPVLLFA